jgi:hypothetical protein
MIAAGSNEPFERCRVCGDRIGAYEPLAVVLPGGTVLRGGLMALRKQVGAGIVHHAACFDGARQQR